MFKRLLARLFGHKPKDSSERIRVAAWPRGHEHIARELAKARSNQATARRFGSSATSSRRDDSSDLMNPLNPLSPVSPIYHSSGDSHHRSSGHDSGGYDGGSCDSSSSSSGGCD